MLKKLKASSLVHAVFVCFLIAAVCFGMLLLSSYTTLFQKKTLQRTQLQLTNDAAIQLALSKIPVLENGTTTTRLFDDHVTTETKIFDWGFYKVVCAKTFFQKDTIQKNILVGRATKSTTALYVTNYDKVVNVAGNVSIIGNLRIPKGTLDRKNMQGEQTKINIQGIRERSEAQLPKLLKMNTAILPTTTSPLTPEMISENDTFIQNFDEETLVMNVANLSFLEGKVVKGNIIFQSNGTLVLKQNMQLEDVIIKAQSVIVEEGFRGNIQIIAETAVTVEDNVQLLYPSSILIWQPKRATRLSIGKESLMMGGVVVKNSNLRNASESMITLAEKATVVGNMYCHGTVQLNGTVYGSVYADRLHTEYDKSSYANLLMNATIDLSKLPKNFIGIPLFEENDKNLVVYETVKEL